HEFTGRISRSHFVHRVDGPTPQFCMVGGKWTTFRAFAEQTADAVLAELGRKRTRDTIALAICGGAVCPACAGGMVAGRVDRYGIRAERAAWLFGANGTRTHDVLAFCRGRGHDVPLDGRCMLTRAEIAYLCRTAHVAPLEDML